MRHWLKLLNCPIPGQCLIKRTSTIKYGGLHTNTRDRQIDPKHFLIPFASKQGRKGNEASAEAQGLHSMFNCPG